MERFSQELSHSDTAKRIVRPPEVLNWKTALLFGFAYFALAHLGLFLSIRNSPYVSLWFPAGLYLAMLLLFETKYWPWIMLSALGGNFLFDGLKGTPFLTILMFFVSNSVEALTGAWIVRRFFSRRPTLTNLGEFVGLVTAAVVAPAAGGIFGAATLTLSGLSSSYSASWVTWWSNEQMAILIIAPLILIWTSRNDPAQRQPVRRGSKLEAVILVTGLVICAWYVLVIDRGIIEPDAALLMLFAIWAGLRFGMRGATGTTLLLAVVMAFLTTHFQKGLSQEQISSGEYLHMLHSILSLTAMVGLIPAIAIGERDRRMADLMESEERYRNLTEAAFEGVIISQDGRIVDANDQVLKLMGYSASEAIGHEISEFVSTDSRAVVEEALRSGKESPYENQIIRKDGTVLDVETQARVLPAQGARVRLTAIRDITARKVSEKQRERLEAQLREVHKMEALGTLAGGTAHEFNNIISIIIGYGELARMSLSQTDAIREDIDAILKAGQRAREVVEQILAFSRQQNAEQRLVKLDEVVLESLRLIRTTLPANVTLDSTVQENAVVLGNATQIQQVIINVCTNAAHALSPNGGVIRVTQDNVSFNGDASEIHPALVEGHYARLSICDNGIGMDASTKSRIFEPFFTTRGQGKGSGLGLAVVHGIMQSHRGTVLVQSEPGKGSTFDLYFPLRMETLVPESVAAVPEIAGQGQHILIVDDEPDLTRIITNLLLRSGYRATGVNSAAKALALFGDQPGEFDFVITDMNMPEMKGTELARILHETHPDLPIILITGYDRSGSIQSYLEFGIRRLIQKPFDADILIQAVHDILQPPGRVASTSPSH